MPQAAVRRAGLRTWSAPGPGAKLLWDAFLRIEQRTCEGSPAPARNIGAAHRASSPPEKWQLPLFNSITVSKEIGSGTGSMRSIASMRKRTSFFAASGVSTITRRTLVKRGRSEERRGRLEFRRVLFRSKRLAQGPGPCAASLQCANAHPSSPRQESQPSRDARWLNAADRKSVVEDWSSDVCSSDLRDWLRDRVHAQHRFNAQTHILLRRVRSLNHHETHVG